MTFIRLIFFTATIFAFSLTAKSKYPVGEKFEFQAYALGFIPIGKVWMDVGTGSFNNIPTHQFRARCYGDYKVYIADVRVSSDLSKKTIDRFFIQYSNMVHSEKEGVFFLIGKIKRRIIFDLKQMDNTDFATLLLSLRMYGIFLAALFAQDDFSKLNLALQQTLNALKKQKSFT